jgi:hypothetical protein
LTSDELSVKYGQLANAYVPSMLVTKMTLEEGGIKVGEGKPPQDPKPDVRSMYMFRLALASGKRAFNSEFDAETVVGSALEGLFLEGGNVSR